MHLHGWGEHYALTNCRAHELGRGTHMEAACSQRASATHFPIAEVDFVHYNQAPCTCRNVHTSKCVVQQIGIDFTPFSMSLSPLPVFFFCVKMMKAPVFKFSSSLAQIDCLGKNIIYI